MNDREWVERQYFDKEGNEIREGDKLQMDGDDRIYTVYAYDDDAYHEIGLGIDSTNPVWIESGRAEECEFGLYPLDDFDESTLLVVNG